jgi:hypothetical protein
MKISSVTSDNFILPSSTSKTFPAVAGKVPETVQQASVEVQYNTSLRFWPVQQSAELADRPIGCGEVARGGCSFVWNLSVTRSPFFYGAKRKTRPGLENFLRACAQNVYKFRRNSFA